MKRLARKLIVLMDAWETLDALGVGVRSMTESLDTSTPMGRFVMQMLGSMAELDRENILEQTRAGRETVIRHGYWPGGAPPLGYRLEHGQRSAKGRRRAKLLENPEEARIIRHIFRLYVEDKMNLTETSAYLNASGVPTSSELRKGKPATWNVSRVQSILRHPVYDGEYVYRRRKNKDGREQVSGDSPHLVEHGIWQAAQDRLTNNLRTSKRNMKRLYLLRGIPRCGLCGRTCVGVGETARNRYYYQCNGFKPQNGAEKCAGVRVRAKDLEDKMWEQIAAFVRNPGKAASLVAAQIQKDNQAEDTTSEVDKLTADIKDIERQRQWVIGQGRRGLITTDESDAALMDTANELEVLMNRRKVLLTQADYHQAQQTFGGQVEAILTTLREGIDNADDETKHWAMQLVIERIVLTPLEPGKVRVEPTFKFAQEGRGVVVSSTRARATRRPSTSAARSSTGSSPSTALGPSAPGALQRSLASSSTARFPFET